MKRKLFVLVFLGILIVQPLVVMHIASGQHAADTSKRKDAVLTQEPGTRLLPQQHTDHVPIGIDGDDDFIAQGWPGTGSEADPYVISGWNITYNWPDYLIKITNTDSYFIIEDCFLKQQSTESGILLENVSHARVQYVTLLSGGGGVFARNAGGTSIGYVHAESNNEHALYINYCPDSEVTHSLFNATSHTAAYVNSSSYSTVSDSVFDSGILDLEIWFSEDFQLLDVEFHAAAIELYVRNCSSFFADGLTALEGMEGIFLYYSNNSEIRNADIATDNRALNVYECHSFSLTDSRFSNRVGSSCLRVTQCSEVTFSNILVNDTQSMGIEVTNTPHFGLQDSVLSNIGGNAIGLSLSNHSQILFNELETVNGFGMDLGQCHWANISHNRIAEGGDINIAASDNGTFAYNFVADFHSGGVVLENCVAWKIHDNTMENMEYGLIVVGGAFTDIWYNDISMCTYEGFYSGGHGLIELWENTISECEYGIVLENCDEQYIRDNVISNCYGGMAVVDTVNSTINDNIISECTENGMYLQSIVTSEFAGNEISQCGQDGMYLDGVFQSDFSSNSISHCGIAGINLISVDYSNFSGNTLVDCGFLLLVEPIAVSIYNHSFSDNTVNGKPLYYALSESDLSIDGNDYGQIILVNCTDSTITGGEFVRSTCPIQLMFGHDITVSNVLVNRQIVSSFALVVDNVTVVDCTFEGTSLGSGIFLWESDGFWAENCSFDGLGGTWFGLPSALLSIAFYNFTVLDCTFTDIDGYAVYMEGAFTTNILAVVSSCEFSNASVAIYGSNTDDVLITDNEMKWCGAAMYASTCDDWNVTWNNVHDNDDGILREGGSDWIIVNNTIRWNNVGMEFESVGTVGVVADNIIALNFYANGIDDTFEYWDDGVDVGNIWGDYTPPPPYIITGVGAAQDRYPRQYVVTEPIINTPEDVYYAEGSTGNEIFWLPFDDYLKNWEVEIDGAPWDSGPWNYDNVTVNIDGLAYGTHEVIITVRDMTGNTVEDTVMVHVYDNTPPEIDNPPDQWLFVDATGQTISWEVSDLNPDTYTLFVDDTELSSGTWESGTLAVDVDGIPEGEHEVRITIFDIDGNSASDTVVVLVIADDESPTVDSPADVTYQEDSTGNSIVWSPSDDYPSSYEIAKNGTVVKSSKWSGGRIVFDIDGYPVGSYDFTITVYDRSGNSATDSVALTVLPVEAVIEEPPLTELVPLEVILAALGILVAVSVVFYLRKRRA